MLFLKCKQNETGECPYGALPFCFGTDERGGGMGLADGLHRRSASGGLHGAPDRLGERRPQHRATGRHSVEGNRSAFELRAMAVEFPVVEGHPNRLPFEGVLT